MSSRIKERELILPTLLLLSTTDDGKMSTTEIIEALRDLLKPTGEDLTILDRRADDKFSQKVRNLVSHNTLGKLKYASHRDGEFKITKKGDEYIKRKYDIARYLVTNDFNWEDIKESFKEVDKKKRKVIDIFDENITVNEGYKKAVTRKLYERSVKLRNAAIKHYKKSELIYCKCCNFNFQHFYGKELGECYIEIHHIKPIFKYRSSDINKCITEAIKNVVPVCSNCHRMIHKDWKKPLKVSFIKKAVSNNGVFSN